MPVTRNWHVDADSTFFHISNVIAIMKVEGNGLKVMLNSHEIVLIGKDAEHRDQTYDFLKDRMEAYVNIKISAAAENLNLTKANKEFLEMCKENKEFLEICKEMHSPHENENIPADHLAQEAS